MAQEKKLQNLLERTHREAEERDAQRRASQAGVSYLNLATQPIETDALELIPEKQAKDAQVAAIEKKGDKAVLVAFDIRNSKAKKIIN